MGNTPVHSSSAGVPNRKPHAGRSQKSRRLVRPLRERVSLGGRSGHERKSHWGGSTNAQTQLMASVLARNWREVLVRARSFPDEVRVPCTVEVPIPILVSEADRTGTNYRGRDEGQLPSKKAPVSIRCCRLRLLPLHAACALRPPPQVVGVLLSHVVASTEETMPNGLVVPHHKKQRLPVLHRFRQRQHKQYHRISPPPRRQRAVPLFDENNTSLATVPVTLVGHGTGIHATPSIARALRQKLSALGRKSNRKHLAFQPLPGPRITQSDHWSEEESASQVENSHYSRNGIGREAYRNSGKKHAPRATPGIESTQGTMDGTNSVQRKWITLLPRQIEDHSGSNKSKNSKPRSSSCSPVLRDFDPPDLFAPLSTVSAPEKQPVFGELDQLFSIEHSTGDLSTSMTTATHSLIDNTGYFCDDGSSSLEYVMDDDDDDDDEEETGASLTISESSCSSCDGSVVRCDLVSPSASGYFCSDQDMATAPIAYRGTDDRASAISNELEQFFVSNSLAITEGRSRLQTTANSGPTAKDPSDYIGKDISFELERFFESFSGDDTDESSGDSSSLLQWTSNGRMAMVDASDDPPSDPSQGDPIRSKNCFETIDQSVAVSGSRDELTTSRSTRSLQTKVLHRCIEFDPLAILETLPRVETQPPEPGQCPEQEESSGSFGVSRVLPIHIACLYEASSPVLRILLEEYSEGSSRDVLGMLPVHMVAAKWSMGIAPPNAPAREDEATEAFSTAGDGGFQRDRLETLVESAPGSLWKASSAHGLRPLEYANILAPGAANRFDENENAKAVRSMKTYLEAKEERHFARKGSFFGTPPKNSFRAQPVEGDSSMDGSGICDTLPTCTTGVSTRKAPVAVHDLSQGGFPAGAVRLPLDQGECEGMSSQTNPCRSHALRA